MFIRPKAKLETLPLERLLFPPQCQQRAGLPGEFPTGPDATALIQACWSCFGQSTRKCVADPKVARELAEALADGAEFDPLEVVREAPKSKRGQPLLYVFGGFTRGAGYKLYGKLASVPCLVYEGTFADAQFWSLSENHKNIQTRGVGSARRAVETLLDSSILMERVRDAAKREGGLHRAIAAACRVSRSTVDDVLRIRGLGVEGSKLIPRRTAATISQPLDDFRAGQTQVPISTTAPTPDPTPEPVSEPPEAPADEPDAEPLYTVPSDFGVVAAPEDDVPAKPEPGACHSPDLITSGGLIVEVKDRVAEARAKADAIIRAAKELDEAIRSARGSMLWPLLERLTFAGAPFLRERTVRERKGTGTVQRTVTACAAPPAPAVAILRRVRPKAVCAGCRGDGCVACKALGFVPDDDTLIQGNGAVSFEFADPWECD